MIPTGFLDLGNNLLTGNIPSEIGKLVELKCKDPQEFHSLRDNAFSPLRQLFSSLARLSLARNRIRGSIPTELGKLDKLSKSQTCWQVLPVSVSNQTKCLYPRNHRPSTKQIVW